METANVLEANIASCFSPRGFCTDTQVSMKQLIVLPSIGLAGCATRAQIQRISQRAEAECRAAGVEPGQANWSACNREHTAKTGSSTIHGLFSDCLVPGKALAAGVAPGLLAQAACGPATHG